VRDFLALPSANALRVTLSTDNDQSDYICASFIDVSCPCTFESTTTSSITMV